MKKWPPPSPRAPRRRHIPAFHPVPVGGRHDGWTIERQAKFIGMLAETRSVLAAARAVSMSRESAYRLRRRPGAASFATAWDAAMNKQVRAGEQPRPKVTDLPDAYRFEVGLIQVIVYAGRYCGFARKADSYGLLRSLSRLGRGRRRNGSDGQRSQIFYPDLASTNERSLPG